MMQLLACTLVYMLSSLLTCCLMCTGPSEQGGVLLDLDGVTLQTPDRASTLVQNLSVKVWLSCLATCFIFSTAVAMLVKEFAGHTSALMPAISSRTSAWNFPSMAWRPSATNKHKLGTHVLTHRADSHLNNVVVLVPGCIHISSLLPDSSSLYYV